jgi:hypothetical protein
VPHPRSRTWCAARCCCPAPPAPGAPATSATAGRNRIHLVAGDLDAEITRLRDAGPAFRGVVAGPGGRQILLADPAGNPIELFQPAHRPASPEEPS